MLEDPATGSDRGLGGWYLAHHATLPLSLTISQGEMTGCPSALRMRIDESRNIQVAGEVIALGHGHIEMWQGAEAFLRPSFRRKPESTDTPTNSGGWIPAFAGMTEEVFQRSASSPSRTFRA